MENKKKVAFYTLGCKLNFSETSTIARDFQNEGFERVDFEEIADRLRRELTEMGKLESRKQWDEIQVKFLKQHQYFTQTAIQMRQEKKMENLQIVIDRLEADQYDEVPEHL